MSQYVVVWFRRDFRLQDHTALYYAINEVKKSGKEWLALFHLDPPEHLKGSPHEDYFFQTVSQFKQRLKEKGIHLHILTGEMEEALNKLKKELPSTSDLYVNLDRVGEGAKRDERAKDICESLGISFHGFDDAYLTAPDQVVKGDKSYYKVFTPYLRTWSKIQKKKPVRLSESEIVAAAANVPVIDEKSERVFQSVLKRCSTSWPLLGEKHALEKLEEFLVGKINDYEQNRDYPELLGTSQLSPCLKVGTISPRTILFRVFEKKDTKGREAFIKELAWRDFYHMIQYYNPDCKELEVRNEYQGFNWNQDKNLLKSWSEGKTGFPIVDAGMRQLKKEGWMHNRLRMITASFLTKDYLIDWRLGERYFEEMLIDYDSSSNIGGWQWAASVGTDAVPYFRVFNPTTQSKRFDKKGEYIRKYIPELRHVEDAFIHEPWKMDEKKQKEAGCLIGRDYPAPSVNHHIQRKKAISMFEEYKNVQNGHE
ncbi:cryptochrome/photolyase family protein [Halalkalibacter nanhaiisediminis]|uniref:Deoxyribodipyrimidine photo-lyase n=1 Tax=Halalkalibacter nanhaiisediminis TaxID=688079 RepID=A0A562QI04_9BACI|nr:deoxyribodipyrimidine photo-lyase [Halalkalibacter nanhaiisediminis]TWI55820.1 deoxyribodipyrimidine photo-lyase [Halalkalibacter nanhaiisediminis]